MTTKGIIIGIAGPTASGKTTAAKILAKKLGAYRAKYSDVLIDIAKVRRLSTDKASLQALSNALRAEHGNDYLGKELWKRLITIPNTNLVIEGNRLMDDMKFLTWHAREEGKQLVLLYIDAETDARFTRINPRLKSEGAPPLSREAFDALERDPCEKELSQVREYIRKHGTVIDTTHMTQDEVETMVSFIVSMRNAA
jgi:cytidylate kinase